MVSVNDQCQPPAIEEPAFPPFSGVLLMLCLLYFMLIDK